MRERDRQTERDGEGGEGAEKKGRGEKGGVRAKERERG